MASKVFLGGTCNGSTWREQIKLFLEIGYFDPVVSDWTPECQEEELRQRKECDYLLYVITPRMSGVYSIAELMDDCHRRRGRVVFCFLETDESGGQDFAQESVRFDEHQLRSLEAVAKLVLDSGNFWAPDLESAAEFLNKEPEVGVSTVGVES